MKPILITLIIFYMGSHLYAQTPSPPFSISGVLGFTYEGYGLNKNPSGNNFYTPRRPWNQVRFNFIPNFQFGKNFSLPFNFNFAMKPTNYTWFFMKDEKNSGIKAIRRI